EWGQARAVDCLRLGSMPARDAETDNIGLIKLLVRATGNRLAAIGRKKGGDEQRVRVVDAFNEMVRTGQVSFERCGLTRAVEKLRRRFPEYRSFSAIEKIIRPSFKDAKTDASGKGG